MERRVGEHGAEIFQSHIGRAVAQRRIGIREGDADALCDRPDAEDRRQQGERREEEIERRMLPQPRAAPAARARLTARSSAGRRRHRGISGTERRRAACPRRFVRRSTQAGGSAGAAVLLSLALQVRQLLPQLVGGRLDPRVHVLGRVVDRLDQDLVVALLQLQVPGERRTQEVVGLQLDVARRETA